MAPFSVLLSVYKNDNPQYFRTAIESVTVNQTVKPSEVYIYVDGRVPKELENTITELQKEIPYINVHWAEENKGLGLALRYGMEHVKYDLVARMDSDDISLPDRFECQLKQFEEHPEISVASGHINEFIDDPAHPIGTRKVPIGNFNIRKYMKKRDGLNHVAVMFRRSEVLRAGNYQDWHYNEDSYLWLRMYLAGCVFDNLDKVLVNVRVGSDMYKRRGGWRYYKSEEALQRLRWKNDIISFPRYLMNCSIHFMIKCLMPNKVRALVFQKFLRA